MTVRYKYHFAPPIKNFPMMKSDSGEPIVVLRLLVIPLRPVPNRSGILFCFLDKRIEKNSSSKESSIYQSVRFLITVNQTQSYISVTSCSGGNVACVL
ncbi:hypothetical protein CDAR_503931 [Caerostris darwini]|uniref:Uncharacterized protein n=1 Tax=Caerostris darwini TaxID=1538125 RepID=A0AAV4PCD6_9ARAC|nr:hypothetical protein CDAR_503931 [Caerostris darwini]